MEQAENDFTKLEGEINNLGLGASMMQSKMTPNAFKSETIQSYEQAKRNFLNSVLRKESGAVISPTEFVEGNKQYFPQPFDKPAVLAQKKENRRIAREGMKQSAGKAYKGITQPVDQGQDIKSQYNALREQGMSAVEAKKRLGL